MISFYKSSKGTDLQWLALQCVFPSLLTILFQPKPLISLNFLLTGFILNLLSLCILPSTFPFGHLPPNEMHPSGLFPLEIMIVEDEQLLIALTLAEVIHVELPNKALQLRVPEVERQDIALEKGDVIDGK